MTCFPCRTCITKDEVDDFIEEANKFHPTINFTAEISEKQITFFDTNIYKGQRFCKESSLDERIYLQAYFSVHEFLFVPPTRCYKRLYQRGSTQAS